MGVNSLPKTITRQRRDCDLNPGPYVPEFSTLTTRLPSHPWQMVINRKKTDTVRMLIIQKQTKVHRLSVLVVHINEADIQRIDAVDQRCLCKESWAIADTTLSEMPTSVELPTSHHFHPSSSPVVSLSLGVLHEWMRTQMLAKPSSNLLQRTGGDHRGGRAQPG